jgi:hypothetical protein
MRPRAWTIAFRPPMTSPAYQRAEPGNSTARSRFRVKLISDTWTIRVCDAYECDGEDSRLYTVWLPEGGCGWSMPPMPRLLPGRRKRARLETAGLIGIQPACL